LFFTGAAGDQRRVFSYQNFPDSNTPLMQNMRMFATISLVVMLLFQIPFLYNFFSSMFKGKRAEKNPWKANTLEWVADSPPPHGNFKELPRVYRPPYEYGVPGRALDYWPQNEEA
jgi:cytochrome c oxidase subunit 1